MNNEQAKQEAIRKAYGGNYSELHSHIDENGWLPWSYKGPGKFGIGQTSLREIYDIFGGIDNTETRTELNKVWFRPISLSGIENNNCWIRIEPDGSNLPQDGYFRILNNNPNIFFASTNDRFDSDEVIEMFEDGSITHYKPIKQELKPIY